MNEVEKLEEEIDQLKNDIGHYKTNSKRYSDANMKLIEEMDELKKKHKVFDDLYTAVNNMSEKDISKFSERQLLNHLMRYKGLMKFLRPVYASKKELTFGYKYYKDIRDNWNLRKFESGIKEYAKIVKLSKRDALLYMLGDLMEEYILMYEWAMNIDNKWIYNVGLNEVVVALSRQNRWWNTKITEEEKLKRIRDGIDKKLIVLRRSLPR